MTVQIVLTVLIVAALVAGFGVYVYDQVKQEEVRYKSGSVFVGSEGVSLTSIQRVFLSLNEVPPFGTMWEVTCFGGESLAFQSAQPGAETVLKVLEELLPNLSLAKARDKAEHESGYGEKVLVWERSAM